MRIRKKTNKRIKKTNKRTRKFRKYNKRTANLVGGEDSDLDTTTRRSKRHIDTPIVYESGLDKAEITRLNKERNKERNKRKNDEREEAKQEEDSEDNFIELHKSLSGERRSKRGECNNTFIPKDVVPGKVGYYAAMPQVPLEKIQDFVETQIEEGPQLVTLPVSGMSHIILVDIQKDKIMISDWRGRKFIDGEDPNYKNYKDLMTELEKKYDHPVQFYFIDPVFLKIAEDKSNTLGKRGGCSEYAFAWSGLYYKNGYYEWPFSEETHPPSYPFLHLLYVKSKRYKGL